MDSAGDDFSSDGNENRVEGSKTAEYDIKAKLQEGGDGMVNNINGHDNLTNHMEEKPMKTPLSPSRDNKENSSKHSSSHKSSHHSSSKHKDGSSKHHPSSSSSKHSSSSSSSKHKEGSSSSSKHSSSSSSHKEGSSSSSSKSKDGSSSSKSKDGHSSSSSKHKDGHHSSSSSKHKEGHHSSSSSKHRDGSSSSSSKHKEGSSSSSSKHGGSSSSSSKHKEGSSSSSSSKHKDGSSSSSSKHSSSHHSSSSSKHKDGSSSHSKSSSSSSSDKHRSKDGSSSSSKDRHGEHRSKDKHSSSSSKSGEKSKEPKPVKEEPTSPAKMTVKTEPGSPHKSSPPKAVKEEQLSDDDVPLSVRMESKKPAKRAHESSDDEDDVPLSARMDQVKKMKKEKDVTPVKKEEKSIKKEKNKSHKRKSEDSADEKPLKKKKPEPISQTPSPQKGKKKGKEETQEVWRWWEEDRQDDGSKWKFLEHKGPVFAPAYEPLPEGVRFFYNGEEMKLSEEAEEVATFYSKMLEHDYTTRDVFNKNFMKDWRKMMTPDERSLITDLSKCNFKEMAAYFKEESEKRKNRTKEEKQALKKENEALMEEYGYCTMDGHKEKIGNFRIEPPGLFRGRGEHPKQGMLKHRILPRDVIINCSKNSEIPQPPKGHKWKEVRHDNKVSWLACWNENIQGQTKYVMLNAASRLKGEKDWQKYETARKLHRCVDKIRANYMEDWKSKEMRVRQRAVALYFIDKLALRAGNEKEEGETADTVGCCSLRVEHLKLNDELNGKECVVEFDFLGKDSIRYYNAIPVEKRVFKNLQLFMDNKQPGDDLFDRLNTTILNKHLHDLMPGLTAKVFRTYNASRTLQEQLNLLTEEDDSVAAKLLSYNRANRAVAVLCNHQRAAPKNFDKQMENLQAKIESKKDTVRDAKKQLKAAKSDYKASKTEKAKKVLELKKKQVARLEEQLVKLEVQATDKDENKEIALGTSKLNYLDPRISVAWCKKWEVPIEKIYNKTQRDKFRWAIDMTEADYEF